MLFVFSTLKGTSINLSEAWLVVQAYREEVVALPAPTGHLLLNAVTHKCHFSSSVPLVPCKMSEEFCFVSGE